MRLEFGIGLRSLENIAQDAQAAEKLGYQFVSTGEHIFFHGPTNNGLIALAAAAGATQSIKLMSAITLVPLYPPALLAKQIATLDSVSNGRFNLGVGVGGEFPQEFEASGVPVQERGARTNEALDIIQRLMTETGVSYRGRFTTMNDVTLYPRPIQQPYPPIWISGRTDAAMKRCAKFGDGWLPYMYTPERLAESLLKIQTFATAIDRQTPVKPGLFIFFAVHSDRQTAIKMATDRLSLQYNQDFSQLVGKYALAGTPDDCVQRLREYADAGAQTIILNSACPSSYIAENEALLAREVIPAFR